MAVYFATKAYVLSFTEALHEELKPHGVKVSALCPGPTRTEFGAVAGIQAMGRSTGCRWKPGPWFVAGLDGLDRNRAVVVTGATSTRSGASVHALRAAVGRAEDRRLAEILTDFSALVPAPH